MWESCIFAATKKLDHLCVIIDDNNSAGAMVDLNNMAARFSSFGFDVFEVDGHDPEILEETFRKARVLENNRPKVVIAHTIRGFGSPTLTDHDIWFHKAPNQNELELLSKEVDEF